MRDFGAGAPRYHIDRQRQVGGKKTNQLTKLTYSSEVLEVQARLDAAKASGVQWRPLAPTSRHLAAPPLAPIVLAKPEIQLDVLHEQALGVLAATGQNTRKTVGHAGKRGERRGYWGGGEGTRRRKGAVVGDEGGVTHLILALVI